MHKPQSPIEERTTRWPNVYIFFAIAAFSFLLCLCFFYTLQMRASAKQDVVDHTSRSRLIHLITVKSLECRRYEKDYCLNIEDEKIRDEYLREWNRVWTQLGETIKSLRRYPYRGDSPQTYARWQTAIKRYQEGFLLVVHEVEEGVLSKPSHANQFMISVKDYIRYVIRDSTEHSVEIASRVDDSRTRLERANIILITGVVGCAIVIACLFLWWVWAARRSAAQARVISECIQSKSRAESANRLKSEFLANMSHEIRTPMTAILGFADTLLDSVVEPDDVEAVNTIKRNGECLLSLINDILDISKIESGKLTLEKVACSPHQVIADVASSMRVRSTAKGLALEVHFDGPIPRIIQSDPTRLRQIFLNIVGNAIKFTKTGSIRIFTRFSNEPGQEPVLRIDVIDTGIGIAQDAISKLFAPFTQADSSTTRKFGGTGLGLAISKRLVEALGGALSVSSTLGQGSTFSVSLPVGPVENLDLVHGSVESAVNKSDSQVDHNEQTALLDRRILLAEDGPDNQRLIAFVLRKAGAEVVVAENGQIAVNLAMHASGEGASFDVILMDMQMPVLDGYSATRQLRSEGYRGPIIALTAHAMTSDRQKCLDAGCDDYTTKPIDKKKLISLISHYASEQNIHTVNDTPVA